MSFTFVTAYFEFNKEKNDFYFDQFKKLVETEFPIILYLDKNLEEKVEELKKYQNLKIILILWEDLFLNKFIKDNNINNIKIPIATTKDNLNFLILMNSKNYFIKEASYISDKHLIIWIDFGIMKITSNIKHFKDNFSRLNNINKILIPGGFQSVSLLNDNSLMHGVFWRFLGGLIICPRNLVDKFDKEANKEVCALLKNNKLTWEINLWTNVEYKNRDLIRYFKADHNSAMFSFYDKKRLAFCGIENDGDNIQDKIKSFMDKFEGYCDGFVINVFNKRNNLAISDDILNFIYHQKMHYNRNVKLNVDNYKNDKRTNTLIVNANLVDYCWELGWDINHTYGLFEKDGILIPLNANFYENFITENIN